MTLLIIAGTGALKQVLTYSAANANFGEQLKNEMYAGICHCFIWLYILHTCNMPDRKKTAANFGFQPARNANSTNS